MNPQRLSSSTPAPSGAVLRRMPNKTEGIHDDHVHAIFDCASHNLARHVAIENDVTYTDLQRQMGHLVGKRRTPKLFSRAMQSRQTLGISCSLDLRINNSGGDRRLE